MVNMLFLVAWEMFEYLMCFWTAAVVLPGSIPSIAAVCLAFFQGPGWWGRTYGYVGKGITAVSKLHRFRAAAEGCWKIHFLFTIYITLYNIHNHWRISSMSVEIFGHHPMLSEPRYSDIVEDQCSWTDQRDGWNELLRSFFEKKHIASSPNVKGLFKESHDNSLGWWHPKCWFKSSFQDVEFSHWVEILTKAAIVTKTHLVHLLSCSKDVKTVINFIALVTEWNQDNDMRRSLIRQPGLTSRVAIAALNKRLTAASPAVETPGETGKDVNERYSNESFGEEDSVEKERSLTDNLTNLLELWVHSISTTKCGRIFKAVLFQSSSADDQLIETYWTHHLKVSVFLPVTCNCFVGHKKV